MKVQVKEWIVDKNLSMQEAQVVGMMNYIGDVEKETEKAVFVVFYSDFGKIKSWFPKSQVTEVPEIDEAEVVTEFTEFDMLKHAIEFGVARPEEYSRFAELCKEQGIENKFANGLAYNEYLKAIALENKLIKSVKRKMCTSTLVKKLEEAKVHYLSKKEWLELA